MLAERAENIVLSTLAIQSPANGAGSVVTNSVTLEFFNPDGTGPAGPTTQPNYICFSGPASNFPPFSSWVDFEDMWNINSVNQLDFFPLDTAAIQVDVKSSILSISAESKVDSRFILAIIMQEVRILSFISTTLRLFHCLYIVSPLEMLELVAPITELKIVVSCKPPLDLCPLTQVILLEASSK